MIRKNILLVKKNNSEIGIFLSTEKDTEWYEIRKENHLIGITSSAEIPMNILVAVEKNKLTNKLMYSFNNGYNWMDYYFSNSLVVVNELIVDQRTHSAAFYLISKKLNNENTIFKVDFLAHKKALPSYTILKSARDKICNYTETSTQQVILQNKTASVRRRKFEDPITYEFDFDDLIYYSNNSLELNYSLVLDSMFKLNYLEVEIFSVESDNKQKLIDRDERDLKNLLKREQKIFTNQTSFIVYNLFPGIEYHFYFYANLTRGDQSKMLKLNKNLAFLKYVSEEREAESTISLLHVAIIVLPVTIFLIVSIYVWLSNRKDFEKFFNKLLEKMRLKMNDSRADEIKNYISEDKKLLIEKSSTAESGNKVETANLV